MASGPLSGLAGLRSLPSSAVRVVGVGAGFVVLVAVLFAGVGAWQGRDVSADAGTATPVPQPAPAPAPAPAPTPDPGDGGEDDPADGEGADDAEGDGSDGNGGATDPATDGPLPQDVSVQLLNGIGADGGAAVERARTTLTDAGFRIAATRNARAYEVTTIFYTVGFEAEGRLVGSVLGTDAVRPMTDLPPDRRLSPGVMVHVVLGTDRR